MTSAELFPPCFAGLALTEPNGSNGSQVAPSFSHTIVVPSREAHHAASPSYSICFEPKR